MKIDTALVKLVKETKAKVAALGAKAKPSQVIALKEEFSEQVVALVDRAGAEITDAEKIAAFDTLLSMQGAALTVEIEQGYRDDDADHYAYEAVATAVFGEKFFDAKNEFENLLPQTAWPA